MPNAIYDVARYRLLTANLDWTALNLQLAALGGTPEFVPEDEEIIDITNRGKPLLGVSMPIPIKSVAVNGTAQTGPVVIPTVPVGQNVTHFAMTEASGALILFIDEAIELPFVPNGLDMVIQPDWLQQRGWWRP
jgi:hypothetical protein